MVDIGIDINMDEWPAPECLSQAKVAEKAGFDKVWISDHFHPWSHTNSHGGFCWVMVSSILANTTTVKASTAVTTPSFRYHPAIVAQAFATLGMLYPGRVNLGLGAGEAMNEVPLGFGWPAPKERVDRLEEALKVIRLLWNKDFVSFSGRYFTLDSANIYDKPTTPVPIYVASQGPRVTKVAGALADGFLCPLDEPHGAAYAESTLLPILRKGALENNRDPHKIRLCAMVGYSYDRDYDKASERCRKQGANLVPGFFDLPIQDPRKIEALAALVDRKEFAKGWNIITDVEDMIGKGEEALRAGFNEIVFQGFSEDQSMTIEEFGRKVIPHLSDASR